MLKYALVTKCVLNVADFQPADIIKLTAELFFAFLIVTVPIL